MTFRTFSEVGGFRVLVAVVVLSVWGSTAAARQEQSSFGTVRGRVVDESGRPLEKATVSITDLKLEATSDEDGHYVLDEVVEGSHRLEASCPGYTGEIVEGVAIAAQATTEVDFALTVLDVPVREIVVTASASLLRDAPAAAVALDRRQITELPHFGDDLYRAVAVLPGVSAGDFSARFAVRGGLYDETLVRLDGQELMEPFHLKDFQGIFSILDPEMIGGVELTPGAFTAEYGDRMTGVLDMVTRAPDTTRFGLGISLTTAWANAAGVFAEGRGSWLASARRGYLDFILKAVGDDDDDVPDPKYWDAFGKLTFAPSHSTSFSLAFLVAGDTLLWEEEDEDELAEIESGYDSSYAWLAYQGVFGARSFVNAALYVGELTVARDFFVFDEFDEQFLLDDVRNDRFYGLRMEWQHDLGSSNYLRWGLDARNYEVRYDYDLDALIDDPIDDPRFSPGVRVEDFHEPFDGRQYALFVTDRMRFGKRFTAEVGVRWDGQTLLDDDQVSPRVNLLYNVASSGVLRLGWGHFYQSQRPYELQVQFGQTRFLPPQLAEQINLGYETELASKLSLKVDAYLRTVNDPHPRWETIFDPWHPVPEVAVDLAEIVPESVNAHGIEVFLANRNGGEFDWWASYAYTSIEDEIDGVDTPRFLNQPHALTASATWRPGPKWSLTGVFHYHTGWAATSVSARPVERPDGIWVLDYDVGPFYQETWDDYYRFDLRASRTTKIGHRGRLTFFIDIQNLTNRGNVRGIAIADPEFEYTEAEGWVATFPEEDWLPIIPSFGVSYEF